MAKNIPLPSGNIFWRDIKETDVVIDGGNHWQADGKVVNWGSQDAKQAQNWLKQRAERDAAFAKRLLEDAQPTHERFDGME